MYSFMRALCAAGWVWFVMSPAASGGTYYSSQPNGEWSNWSTWGGSGVPRAGDRAVITTGHAVTITRSDATVNSLDIEIGTVLYIGDGPTLVIGQDGGVASGPSADLNGDGGVDGSDLAILLGQWTGTGPYVPCPPVEPADLDQDCRVNGLDLAILLGDWG